MTCRSKLWAFSLKYLDRPKWCLTKRRHRFAYKRLKMLKWINNKYAKFDQNIPCGLRFMSIYTNWPLPAWLMLGKTFSVKRNCYACQCLDNVDMYTFAKFDQIIPSGYKVRSNQQRQNHRKRMDSSGSYWWPRCVIAPNLSSGFSWVSFKTQTC